MSYQKKIHGDRIVMTGWDIATEVFGDDCADNYVKIRRYFLSNRDDFEEGEDYFDVTRTELVSIGVTPLRGYNATKYFQLYTQSGVTKVLQFLDCEDLSEIILEKFEDEPIKEASVKVDLDHLKEEIPAFKEEDTFDAIIEEESEEKTLLSEDVLSLTNYLTTCRSLFNKKICGLEVGSVILRGDVLGLITNLSVLPGEKTLLEYSLIGFVEGQWIILENKQFIVDNDDLCKYQPLSSRGVDFIVNLNDEFTSIRVNSILSNMESLREKRDEINIRINNNINSLKEICE